MIEVIDYGGGNLGSVLRCLKRLDIPYRLVEGGDSQPSGKAPLLLPGVGSFGAVMRSLQERRLIEPIQSLVSDGTPYLGICLGLQILFESSEESPDVPGLSLLKGTVRRYRTNPEPLKIPQIGWNKIEMPPSNKETVFPKEGFVYFVNSYYADPADPAVTLYTANYAGPFCAAVRQGAMLAFQFHPEKSGAFGHQLLAAGLQAHSE